MDLPDKIKNNLDDMISFRLNEKTFIVNTQQNILKWLMKNIHQKIIYNGRCFFVLSVYCDLQIGKTEYSISIN